MDALPSASASASASCLTWLTTEIRPPTHPPPPTAPSSSKKLPQLCYIFRPARASDSIIQYIKIELFAKCLGALKCSECSICDKNEPLAQLFKFRSSICLRLVVPRITTDHLKCQRSAQPPLNERQLFNNFVVFKRCTQTALNLWQHRGTISSAFPLLLPSFIQPQESLIFVCCSLIAAATTMMCIIRPINCLALQVLSRCA